MPEFNQAFWDWFGDSQVVDEHGQPLVVYHGTPENFSEFRKRGTGRLAALYGPPSDSPEGFFFTTSPKTAEEFAWKAGELTGGIMPVYLSIRNPLVTDFVLKSFNTHKFAEIIRQAKREGYDGVAAFMQYLDEESSVFVAFYPEQIKSATGNDGTWDSDDPDIRSNPHHPRAHLVKYIPLEGWVSACGRRGPFQDSAEDPQEFYRLWNRCRACQKALEQAK